MKYLERPEPTDFASKSAFCLTALLLLLLWPHPASANDKVRLQLKWQHQFQFAGYYAAKERGYYQAAGLDVEIVPLQPGDDPVKPVLQGKAEFGVGSTDLLLLREQGEPVVVLAVIFQHSPLALMVLKQSGLQSIHDLAGRKVMIEPGSSELHAYLRKEGISVEKFILLPHGFHTNDLLAGNVYAMSTYLTDEPFELNQVGREYLLYSPRSVGIDFYGDNLFTTERQLTLNPERVKAFRAASLKGWEYAMQHPEELVQLIHSRYSQRHSMEHLRFEASQMVPLLQASLVEIGHINPGRWRHIAEVYAGLDMMKPDFDLKGFLYDLNPPPPDLTWFYGGLAAALTLLMVAGVIAIRFSRLSAALHNTLRENRRREESLKESEEQFRNLFVNAPVGIFHSLPEGRFLTANPALAKMLGYSSPEELITVTTDMTTQIYADQEVRPRVMDALLKSDGWVHYDEVIWRRKDHRLITVDMTGRKVLNAMGAIAYLEGFIEDITERKEAQRALEESNSKLEILSTTDGLTGIANRRRFDEVLAQEYARHLRSKAEMSLILLDIDHFKAFNDSYGHVKGDECLRQIGRVIAQCVTRAVDLVARYGGEEFACILPETDLDGAIVIAEKIRRAVLALAIPHKGSSTAEVVSVSLGGVTVKCTADNSVVDILAQVDELLYRAKSSGRNRAEFAAPNRVGVTPAEGIQDHFVQLVWKDSFCSGSRLIDQQHQSLFQTSNELFEAVLSGRSFWEISAIIARLLDDVTQHFHDEEVFLESIRLPGRDRHVAEHAKLLARGQELSHQFNASTLSLGDVFQFLVYDMVVIHMLGADREYFPFICNADAEESGATEKRHG